MSTERLVAQAQGAAVAVLNGLSDLERYLEELGDRGEMLRAVREVYQTIRPINVRLGCEVEGREPPPEKPTRHMFGRTYEV